MRLVSRLLILFLGLSIVTLLLVGRCGLHLDHLVNEPGTADSLNGAGPVSPDSPRQPQPELSAPPVSYYIDILREREDRHRREFQRLNSEILALKMKISELEARTDCNSRFSWENSTNFTSVVKPTVAPTNATATNGTKVADCGSYVQKQIRNAEVVNGAQLNNEYELIPFSHFTFSRVYPVDLGLGKRVVEKPIGYKRKDLLEVLVRSIDLLNRSRLSPDQKKFTVDDFIEGIYRVEPTSGTHYELYFRDRNSSSHGYNKITLMRPFAPLYVIENERMQTSNDLINIILPLSGRVDTFKSFMDKFMRVGVKHDRRLFLTVVYFGQEGLQDVRRILTKFSKDFHFRNITLLTLNESFSRGKGLQIGAQHWSGGDVLMFLCDVDVVFSVKFLERCRMNASPGKKVYYPIVFSLYNPAVVYSLQDKELPSETDQLVISRDTGFWRDFGFGMTCQYRSDFLSIKGFDEDIIGWGGEDVMLFRKYVKSSLMVIRATDPGIFHIWHEKQCDLTLTAEQYRACLRSKAFNEASHAQLGLLAFRDELKKFKGMAKEKTTSTSPSLAEVG